MVITLYQFFLRTEDIGKPRAAATLPRLAELNAYVPVRDLGGKKGDEISVDLIKGYHASAVSLLMSFALMLNKMAGRCSLRCILQETVGD